MLNYVIFLGNRWRNVYSSQWSLSGRRRQHYRCWLAQWPRPSLHLFRCLYHQIRFERHESRWIWSTQWNLHLSRWSHHCCGFWKQPSANILRILWYWRCNFFEKNKTDMNGKGLPHGCVLSGDKYSQKPEKSTTRTQCLKMSRKGLIVFPEIFVV